MIGFNHLGKLGRFGNQMFQYAALKGIAANKGYDFCIPSSSNQQKSYEHQLFIPFNLDVNVKELNGQYITDELFCFNKDIFDNCPDNISLIGYFQTEKYFKHIKEEIKKDFAFKTSIYDVCKEIIDTIKSPIALHIRRTDYLTDPNHNALSMEYYEEALKKFDSSREVVIFSDDTDWCSKQEIFAEDRFLISDGQDTYHDMCLMTLCEDHIIANSSFSWWGAWLAEGNKVIAPSKWFDGGNLSYLNTKDLIPEEWEKI
jgi:hypothetical protein